MVKADSRVGGRSDAEWWGWRRVAGLLRGDSGRKWLRTGELELANDGWSRSRSRSWSRSTSTSSQVNWNEGSPWLVSRTAKAGVGGIPGGSMEGMLVWPTALSMVNGCCCPPLCGSWCRGVRDPVVKRSKRGLGEQGASVLRLAWRGQAGQSWGHRCFNCDI